MASKSMTFAEFMEEHIVCSSSGQLYKMEPPFIERVAFNEYSHELGYEENEALLEAIKDLYLNQEQISEVKVTDMKYHGYRMGNCVNGGYLILCDDNMNRLAKKVKFLN